MVQESWKTNKFENENQFQAAAVKMISQLFPRIRNRMWHTKNEGYIPKFEKESETEYKKRCMMEGNRNKAAGMKAGVPDISFTLKGLYYGIELKQPNGKLSDAQIEFHKEIAMDCNFNPVAVCYTLEQVYKHCFWAQNNGFCASRSAL